MVSLNVVVFLALVAAATAAIVQQCPGKNIDALDDNVQLSPCKRRPCKLKKGTDQHITIKFTPSKNLNEIKNQVSAKLLGIDVPFVGVDGNSICEKLVNEAGEKVSCPVEAGKTYKYEDSFPILPFYPNINTDVHWALKDGDDDIICFEVPVRIV